MTGKSPRDVEESQEEEQSLLLLAVPFAVSFPGIVFPLPFSPHAAPLPSHPGEQVVWIRLLQPLCVSIVWRLGGESRTAQVRSCQDAVAHSSGTGSQSSA